MKLSSYPIYWASLAFGAFCRALPASLAERFGRLLGAGVWHFLPEHRKNRARKSLREYFGADEKETERILRASLERYGPMGVEVMREPLIAKDVERYIDFTADEAALDALNSGKGGVLVTLHSGNWELFGIGMAHYSALSPAAAMPAADVTACCSAMPTSKNLSGNFCANFFSPVPSGIAAVTAAILQFREAI